MRSGECRLKNDNLVARGFSALSSRDMARIKEIVAEDAWMG
jgi:hypothetical protein